MPTGVIKFYDKTKGYGFIKQDVEGMDAFIHAAEVKRSGLTMTEGARVQFDLEDGKPGKGPKAVNLVMA